MTSEELSKAATCSAVTSSETTAEIVSTKTTPAITPVYGCVSCLVCGEPIHVYGSYEPRLCNECKRAILAMRETMKS